MNDTAPEKTAALFRTSLSGFNKEDVNNYILRMNRDFRERETELREELEQTRTQLDAKNRDLDATIEKQTLQLAELRLLSEKKETERAQLEQRLREAEEAAQLLEQEKTAQTEKNASVQEAVLEKNLRIAELERAVKSLETDHAVQDAHSDSEMKELRRSYEAKLEILQSRLDNEMEKTVSCERILTQQRDVIDAMKEERDALATAKTSAEETCRILSEQMKSSGTDTDSGETNELLEKSQMYDQISRQIGEIVINANKTADEIVERANAKSARILETADLEAKAKKQYIADTAEEILRKFSCDMHVTADQCIAEISETLNSLQYGASALIAEMEKKKMDISDKVSYYRGSITELMKQNLALLDSRTPSNTEKK